MKLIIAGSRHLDLAACQVYDGLATFLLLPENVKEVCCGECRGPDMIGKYWAEENGIKVQEFPADWDRHGKAAGPIRNREMAEYADALILFWDGKSAGSSNMKLEMQKRKKPVYEVIFNEPV